MIFVNFPFLIELEEHCGIVYQKVTVVKAESVNSFKGRLDRFWNDQEVKYNWKADIKGTVSRSNVAVAGRPQSLSLILTLTLTLNLLNLTLSLKLTIVLTHRPNYAKWRHSSRDQSAA